MSPVDGFVSVLASGLGGLGPCLVHVVPSSSRVSESYRSSQVRRLTRVSVRTFLCVTLELLVVFVVRLPTCRRLQQETKSLKRTFHFDEIFTYVFRDVYLLYFHLTEVPLVLLLSFPHQQKGKKRWKVVEPSPFFFFSVIFVKRLSGPSFTGNCSFN